MLGSELSFPYSKDLSPYLPSPDEWLWIQGSTQISPEGLHLPVMKCKAFLVCASSVCGQRWEEISPTRVKTWKQSKGRENNDLGSYAELGPSTLSSLLCHIILRLTFHDNLALFRCGLIHQPRTLHDPLQNTWPSAKCSEASVCFCENWSKPCPHENTCLVLSPWCK